MNARNILAKKREFMIVLSAMALIACLLSGCGSSTGAHAGITRLDDEGYLYYMDYTKVRTLHLSSTKSSILSNDARKSL